MSNVSPDRFVRPEYNKQNGDRFPDALIQQVVEPYNPTPDRFAATAERLGQIIGNRRDPDFLADPGVINNPPDPHRYEG